MPAEEIAFDLPAKSFKLQFAAEEGKLLVQRINKFIIEINIVVP